MTMSVRARMTLAASLVALTVPLVATSASAAAQPSPGDTIEFGSFSGATYDDIIASAVQENGADKVTRFLEATGGVAPEGFPGLDGLSAQAERNTIESTITDLKAGNLPSIGGGGVVAYSTPSSAIDQSWVYGSAINSWHSWQFTDRFTWTTCSFGPIGCENVGWIEYRVTTDPGITGSKASINATYWGSKLNHNVTYAGKLYSLSSLYSSATKPFYASGTGTLWYLNHRSLLNRYFQFSYAITVQTTAGGSYTAHYATKPGNCYESPVSGRICIFDH